MNYIISENRLSHFIERYLDNFVKSKVFRTIDPYIVVSEINPDDDNNFIDFMEHDRIDGRLWINKLFLESFMKLFAMDKQSSQKFISDWFSDRYGVQVKFVE